jgi:hypothetical protein
MTPAQRPQLSLAALYEQDFCRWADQTAQLLREGNFADLDLAHLLEEIEDMSGSQKRALLNNLRVLLMHLLKYQYQPDRRSPSWRSTIIEHRLRLEDALEESPSLRPYLLENVERTYQKARKQAAVETDLAIATFPSPCPYAVDQVLNDQWLPE